MSPPGLGSFVGLVLLFAGALPVQAQWEWTPRLRVGGGEESDLVVDPALTGEVVPAGAFVELAPSLRASRWWSTRARLDLGGSLSFQRYLEDTGRRLLGHSLTADLRWGMGDRWMGRLSASGDFYDDSERSTVRRLGGGGELGLTFLARGSSIEIWAGGRGRSYPDLALLQSDGSTVDYAEGGASAGLDLRWGLSRDLRLYSQLVAQSTSARDADFDSRALSVSAGLEASLGSALRWTGFGSWQERTFTERLTDDQDSYRQAGVGLAWSPSPRWTLEARGAVARYRWPDGSDETSHRVSLSVTRVWSLGATGPPMVEPAVSDLPSWQSPDEGGAVELRLHAPDAESVSAVGDFNHWDPRSHPLRRDRKGWWTLRIGLAPGSYQYAYVVDGAWITPPEAILTVDDGFGGRNGILEVLAPAGDS